MWNSGIFVWRAGKLLDELKKHEPGLLRSLDKFSDDSAFLYDYFRSAPPVSVDYAVMEKTDSAVVIPTSIGWSDVGTWNGIKELMDSGANVTEEVRSVIEGDEKMSGRRIIPKPWGHEELWAHTDRYVGKILFIRKGCRLSLQYHEVKDETLRVLSGSMEMELNDGQKREMRTGDIQHVAPGMHHRIRAFEDCLVLEVSTPEIEDVVRVTDDYGR